MATATIPFDYSQILALALQLSQSERQRLCDDLLQGSSEKSWTEIFDMIPQADDITEEEILAECDIVRERLYHERLQSCI